MLKKIFLSLLLVLVTAAGILAQTNGYPPKINSYGNWFNRVRPDSAQHLPHKYGLTQNTTDSTPQIFVWSTASGDSLIFFVNGRYHIVGLGGGGGSYLADETTLHLSGSTFSINSAYSGQNTITTLGTVTSGIWQSTPVADAYIASASAWNAKQTSVLNSAKIWVGNGSNVAQERTPAGDLTMDNAGNFTLGPTVTAGSCTNCNLTYDAKGRITVAANGSSGSGGNPFADNAPLVKNNADASRTVTIDASAVATGTNRTLTAPNANGTIVLNDNTATLTGKTIAAGSNSITGLTNANLSGSAGITNANLVAMAAHTYKGNNTGSSATPVDVTATQLTADLNPFTTSLQGLVPSPGGSSSQRELRDDGSWHPSTVDDGVTTQLNTSTGVLGLRTAGIGAGTCTNCNVSVDIYGRAIGYSSGSNISSFWTPETFGAIPDGVTDCTIAFQRAIDSAASTKGTVLLSKGTYLVRCSYKDTATTYKPSGLKLRSNVTIDGPGVGAVVKIMNPFPSTTFTNTGAPYTFSKNAQFFPLFNLDTVYNVILRNFSINGNYLNQVNYIIDPYKNPQDGTTTGNVQTDGIRIRGGDNNVVYNVRIDSVTGYGIKDSLSTNNVYDHVTVTTCINGGVYYSIGKADGSKLQNSLITNNMCDNVRIRGSNVFILNNEISWCKFNPNGGTATNFAGLYMESTTGNQVQGVVVAGNYIHDNSAYGIDSYHYDTIIYTYPGISALITNNYVAYNGAGGIQNYLPYQNIENNIILNNGMLSDGRIDSSASNCNCSIHINGTSSHGVMIVGNQFKDTRKTQKSGGLAGPVTDLMTFTNNMATGVSLTNPNVITYTTTYPFNNVHGNIAVDTFGVYRTDIATDGNGNLRLTPNNGTPNPLIGSVYLGDGGSQTANAFYVGNYKGGPSGSVGLMHQIAGVTMNSIRMNNGAAFRGLNSDSTGRQITFYDDIGSSVMGGFDGLKRFHVGSSSSNYALRVSPIGTDLNLVNAGVELVATGNGSTNNIVEAAAKATLNAGYAGSGYPMAMYMDNESAGTGNSIAGAGNVKGNFGFYAKSAGAATTGTNIGGIAWGGGALRNVGIIGDASFSQFNSASAVSIGTAGFALRNNASAVHVGGYFGLQSTQPTFTSAALMADNGATSDPVFVARVNGTAKVSIGATGSLLNGTTTEVASSMHTMSSTTQGILIPRMNTTQQNAISSPATWLLIWNTDSATFCYYSGTAWLKIGSSAGSSFYQTIQSNGSSQTQRAKLNFSSDFTVSDNSGNGSTDIGLPSTLVKSVNGVDGTGLTSYQTIATYAVPADGLFEVGAYLLVNSISTNQVKITINFTDRTNVGRTISMYPPGSTSDLVTLTGYYGYPTMTIDAKNGTNIVIATDGVGGGSINYNIGTSIKKIR